MRAVLVHCGVTQAGGFLRRLNLKKIIAQIILYGHL